MDYATESRQLCPLITLMFYINFCIRPKLRNDVLIDGGDASNNLFSCSTGSTFLKVAIFLANDASVQ